MRVQDVLRESEDGGAGGGAGGAGGAGGGGDVEFFRGEAKKAFAARDKVKEELRLAQEAGRLLTDDQLTRYRELEAAAERAAEEKKKAEGQWDTLRTDLLKKHDEALNAERTKATQATERLHAVLRDHAFASASEWFGGDGAKTILTPAIAAAYFGRYVSVEEVDGAERVVVKDPRGHVIVDAKTGEPAAFAQAIGELIGMLPDKASILRGSGKTGSGNSGGRGTTEAGGVVDVRRPLTAEELRDPKARAAAREQMAGAGGLQVGAGIPRR